MDTIKVSVIIPTFKRSEDITRAVNSVLSQTIDGFEVIVVDDNGIGTEEGIRTARKMKQYSSDKRVIYIQHQENCNGAVARNTGIRVAHGEFIAFLDDDDAYLPTRLEKMYNHMKKQSAECGACYSGYVKHMAKNDQYSGEKAVGDLYVQALMRSLYIGSGSNLFFRKSVVDEIGFFNEDFKRNQDLEYLIRVLQKYTMAYVDEVLLEIFYDIRQPRKTKEQWYAIEQSFYDCFRTYVDVLPYQDQKKVHYMYAIDDLRNSISYRDWKRVINILTSKKIPLRILIKYIMYIIRRWKTKTCYGFMF